MNSVIIIAHSPLAQALRQCVHHIFPDCDARVQALDVLPDAPPETTFDAARALVQTLPGDLLVLTDLFGSTPSNIAQRLVQHCTSQGRRVREVTGVNLPMLLRLVCHSNLPFESLEQCAITGGTQGVFAVDTASGTASCTLYETHSDTIVPTSKGLF